MDTTHWERTPRGKIICPECGATGYPVRYGPSWLDKHRSHTDCPDCGKRCSTKGLRAHQRIHATGVATREP